METNRQVTEQTGLPEWLLGSVAAIFAVLALTAGLVAISPYFPLGAYPVFYMLLIMAIAYLFGEIPTIFALILGLLAFDYFFVTPIHTIWPVNNTIRSWAAETAYFIGAFISAFAAIAVRRAKMQVDELVKDLQKSNRQVINIFESITEAFFALDRDWRFTYANKEAERLTKRSRNELIGKNIWEEFPDLADSPSYDLYHKAMDEGTPVQFETISKLTNTYVEVRIYPSADVLSVYMHDISERKQAEEAMQRLSAIVEQSDDAIFSKSLDGIILTWNSGAQEMYGYNTDEIIGKSISTLVPPGWPDDTEDILKNIRRGEKIDHYEAKRITKDERCLDVSLTISPIRNAEGEIIAASTIARDITERKKAEEVIRQSEEKYRTLFETMAQGALYFDTGNRIISLNPAAEEILGRREEDLVGKTFTEAGIRDIKLDGSDLSHDERPSVIAFREGKEVRNLTIGIFNPKDNGYRWVNVSAIPLFRPGESRPHEVYTTFGDITETIQLRQALEHNYVLLQRALFPSRPAIGEGYDAASEYVPAYEGQEIGGDFYDVFETANGKTAILIGDVSGKGIEAAALAATTRSTIRAFAFEAGCAAEALTHANATLYPQGTQFGAFVTLFLAILDMKTGHICYSSAGHPPIAMRRSNGTVEFLEIGHPPIGLLPNYKYSDWDDQFEPDDKMILYTDGISESRRGIELFGQEGIERTLKECGHLPPKDLASAILHAARDWAGGNAADDAAIVVISRNEE